MPRGHVPSGHHGRLGAARTPGPLNLGRRKPARLHEGSNQRHQGPRGQPGDAGGGHRPRGRGETEREGSQKPTQRLGRSPNDGPAARMRLRVQPSTVARRKEEPQRRDGLPGPSSEG
eukprot:15463582-Alexandrium_andersonii.AAC.1